VMSDGRHSMLNTQYPILNTNLHGAERIVGTGTSLRLPDVALAKAGDPEGGEAISILNTNLHGRERMGHRPIS